MLDFKFVSKKNVAKIRFGHVLCKFANDKNVKGFPALAFLCWCRKNTTVKSTTVKGYLSALRKIKARFPLKKGKKDYRKNYFERNGKH